MSHIKAQSEDLAAYTVETSPAVEPTSHKERVIAEALAFLSIDVSALDLMGTPSAVRQYLAVRNGACEDQHVERFTVLFLDPHNRLICDKVMFTGSLTQTTVYPREVVREALKQNAASVILSHNHPSGNANPSRADEVLTNTLKNALALVDVRVLDHIIVAGSQTVSMAESGLV